MPRTTLLPSSLAWIGAQPHRAAEVAARRALLEAFRAHPFGDEADDRLRCRSELGGGRLGDAGRVPRAFDAGHLHAKADSEEGNLALAGEFDRSDLSLRAALAESAGHEDRIQGLELGDDVRLRMLEISASIHSMLTLVRLAMPPWTRASRRLL